MSPSIPRPEYPRPDLVRERWLNLNGEWQFELDPGLSGIARGLANPEAKLRDRIVVPFCPESRLSGIGNTDFMRGVWYRRTFRVPEEWRGQRVVLHFGALDYLAQVWVNGKSVGWHRGGYVPFSFDITDALKRGQNVLTVFAEDDTRSPLQPSGKQSDRYESHGCHYTRTTGIWQTVWLESVPAAYVRRLRIVPILELGAVRVDVHRSPAAHGALVHVVVKADGEKVGEVKGHVVGDLASVGTHVGSVRPWLPSDPFLYDVEVTLSAPDGSLDRVTSYAGFRSLGIRGPALLLNGKPKFQRLVLDQGFYPDGIYTAPTDEDLKRDIEISLGLGFDGARLHMKVFEPRFLYWADRLGYLVWGEFPNWGIDHGNPAALARLETEWFSVLERDLNHPSIVGWCPFNETPTNQDPDTLRLMWRSTKLIDPTRPCIDTSGYVHTEETDVYDCHCYDQDPKEFAEKFEPMKQGGDVWHNFPNHDAPWKGQPFFVSEYGGVWWNPGQKDHKAWGYGDRPRSEEEFLDRYRKLTETLLLHPKMCGFCYTQLYDIEQEVNGLYTYDGKPKFDPAIIRRINQQKAAVEE